MRTALVVIDVQPVWLEMAEFRTIDGDDLVEKCCALIERARGEGVPVIYIEHTGEAVMPEGTPTEAIRTHRDLAPGPGDPVVFKSYQSAFVETNLADVLSEREIGRTVICGLSTFGCVQATVLFAKLLGYETAVVADAVAGSNAEGFPARERIPPLLGGWKACGIEILGPQVDPFAA